MTGSPQPADVRNEHGLSRQLSSVQQTTMALGGAIGPACSWPAGSPSTSPAPPRRTR